MLGRVEMPLDDAAARRGARLKRRRERTGLSQEELAGLAGVARSTVAHAEEGGKSRRPQAAAMDRALSAKEQELGLEPEFEGPMLRVEMDMPDGREIRVFVPDGPDAAQTARDIIEWRGGTA